MLATRCLVALASNYSSAQSVALMTLPPLLSYSPSRYASCFHACFCSLSGLFVLNNQSGALSLARPLDYESAVQHVLNISASDMGEPRRQAFSDIKIHVTDANDNSPVLQSRIIRTSVEEVRDDLISQFS